MRQMLAVLAAACGLVSCSQKVAKPASQSDNALLTVSGPLSLHVGDQVDWRFQVPPGAGGGREFVVFSAVADALPFGVLLHGNGTKDVHLDGKVLGPEFRFGKIIVQRRDVRGCFAQAKGATMLATKNAVDAGQSSGALPLIDCEDFASSQGSFDVKQTFFWQIVDTADSRVTPEAMAPLTSLLTCLRHGSCPQSRALARRNGVERLDLVSSETMGPLSLGRCGEALTFAACRSEAPTCVWTGKRCVGRHFYP